MPLRDDPQRLADLFADTLKSLASVIALALLIAEPMRHNYALQMLRQLSLSRMSDYPRVR